MGFWRKTAALVGDNPNQPVKNLWYGAKLVILSALSLFLMLLGIGKLMVPIPGESSLLPWIYVIVSLALIPLWWRGAIGKQE